MHPPPHFCVFSSYSFSTAVWRTEKRNRTVRKLYLLCLPLLFKMRKNLIKPLDNRFKTSYTKDVNKLILKNRRRFFDANHTGILSYQRNQLTIRISELTQQMHTAKTQTEYDLLNSRKRLLQTERLELLRDMQTMMPYVRGRMPIA